MNRRMAYVSVSRAQFDVRMYTNDAKALGQELSRDVSHPTAIQQEPAQRRKSSRNRWAWKFPTG
ncbi:MAG: hypothetical protein WBD67_06600 [Terracidiphilus sp.]